MGGYLLAVIRMWRPSSAAAAIAWSVSAVVTVMGWVGFTLTGAHLPTVLLLAMTLVMTYGLLVALVGGYRLNRKTAAQLAMARGEGAASTTSEAGSIFKLRGNSSITF
ncbi:hypothetical protein D8Y23_15290 [Microbacterium enclense]|uniref:Uncharacterized protein n=1 Tax=Microbacterium enclense TaxID=993073 RepID=A0A3S3LSA4_9MICO|nr:hypothetical protein [Microbacterium enclense]RWR15818.1 hypothetical protein D8Y23_15290 [Microbacterium enclense]